MSQFPPRGILRNADRSSRQTTSQSIPAYISEEMYSHERNIPYHSNAANMPIFAEDETSIPKNSSKSQNADLLAEALATKFRLGLLDEANCSLETLHSYGIHVQPSLGSLAKQKELNPHSSQQSSSSFQQNSNHHYNDLSDVSLSPYNDSSGARNIDDDQLTFKPLTNLNLNSVDDEDEFLYGDSNPLPAENSSFQNDTMSKMKSNESYFNNDLLDRTPEFDKYHESILLSKSKELNADEGMKLSISAWKKGSSWNYDDDSVADVRSIKLRDKESSLISKQYKESFGSYSSSSSGLNKGSNESHRLLHHNLDNPSRQSNPFETEKKNTFNFAKLDSPLSKITHSLLNQSIPSEINAKKHEAVTNILRKQFSLDKSTKNYTALEERLYLKRDELSQSERRVIYDEKKSVDKSSSNESLKFPKLLINVQKGDSTSGKRVVQVKENRISSNKYNLSLSKSESSLTPSHNVIKCGDLEVHKNVYESDDLKTRRIVCDKTKTGREPVNVGSKDEIRDLPKRYVESSHKKSDEPCTKQRLLEKVPKKYSDKHHFLKEGMDSELRSKSKNHWSRSPERRRSPSYSPRGRSPSYSPKRRSPEYYRRRSPSYSPPNYHSRHRSPNYRYYGHSPSYRSHDPSPRYRSRGNARDRSPERSSRREKRSYDQSPNRSTWPSLEKESKLAKDGCFGQNFESKKISKYSWDEKPIKGRTGKKRAHDYSSEDQSDDEQRISVNEIPDKFKTKESVNLKETECIKSDVILSKKAKTSVPDNDPNSVTKIMHSLGIVENTSDPFMKNDKVLDIPQGDSPDSKVKRSEMMNSLLNKLGLSSSAVSSSTSTVITTVTPTTAWTAAPSTSTAPISTAPQQLNVSNVHQYGMQYPQQPTPVMPQIYPQYMYGTSTSSVLPTTPHPPPYNPMYPPPVSPASTFSYPSPSPPTSNIFNPLNFHVNNRSMNPNNKGRISFLKPVPVMNAGSNSDLTKFESSPNQNDLSSPSKNKMFDAYNILNKGLLSEPAVLETNSDSTENEQNLTERYKKVWEEKKKIQVIVKNTSDHVIQIGNLKRELEKKKSPRSSADKQLNIKCASLYEEAKGELTRHLSEAKQLKIEQAELKKKIKKETLEILDKEATEKKSMPSSTIKYAGYDARGHWCENCNQLFETIPKMMEHLHSEEHMKHVDMSKVVTNETPKESFDKNIKLTAVKGTEFIMPYGFYCSLCNEALMNQSYAEHHLKGTEHIGKYLVFLKENPIYEKKRELFKTAGMVALASERRQKDLDQAHLARQLIKEKQQIKEVKIKKELDALKTMQDKLQHLKDSEKQFEELDESSVNVRNSSQSQKGSGIKLTLANEKTKAVESPESSVVKESEVKLKQKVIYIGRAPNYKPRQKKVEIKSSVIIETDSASLNKRSNVKDEKGKKNTDLNAPDTLFIEKPSVPDSAALSEGFKIKSTESESDETSPNQNKKQIKKRKIVPGCQSEAEAKESEKLVCNSKKMSSESFESQSDKSEINQAIKKFINSHKIGDLSKADSNLSGIKLLESPSKIPTHISSPRKKSLSVQRQPLTEEENDFFLLGICKSDMEPLAIPRPPPSNLIHNHSDAISKSHSVPPFQVPPPDIISKVPPPSITSQVPPPNFTSQVPPPNIVSQFPPPSIASQIPPPNITVQLPPPSITSKVPPPNITSNVPPPSLVLQWSSEQKLQSNVIPSKVSVSHNDLPSITTQSSHASETNEEKGLMDMDVDTDLVCSEIKVLSDDRTPKELSVSTVPVVQEEFSSLSSCELCAKNNEQDSSKLDKEKDDRIILKDFLSSLMDSVTNQVIVSSKDEKNSVKSTSELLSNKTYDNHKFSSCSASCKESTSLSQSINCAVEISDGKLKNEIVSDYVEDIPQIVPEVENNVKNPQETDTKEISMNEECANSVLTLMPIMAEEFLNENTVKKSVLGNNPCSGTKFSEFVKPKDNVMSISSEVTPFTNDNETVDESIMNSFLLINNPEGNNVNTHENSSLLNSTSNANENVLQKEPIESQLHKIQSNTDNIKKPQEIIVDNSSSIAETSSDGKEKIIHVHFVEKNKVSFKEKLSKASHAMEKIENQSMDEKHDLHSLAKDEIMLEVNSDTPELLSQAHSFNDFIPKAGQNYNIEDEANLIEDSQSQLETVLPVPCSNEIESNHMNSSSTDGPPFLDEFEGSTNKLLREVLKETAQKSPSSSEMKESKGKISTPCEISRLDNLSHNPGSVFEEPKIGTITESSGDMKKEIKLEEFYEIEKSSSVIEAEKHDTHSSVQDKIMSEVNLNTPELPSQVHSFNEFRPKAGENCNIEEKAKLVDDSRSQVEAVIPTPCLEKNESSHINSSSTDRPPILHTHEFKGPSNDLSKEKLKESFPCTEQNLLGASKSPSNEEEEKIRTDSDTDEYEAAEN